RSPPLDPALNRCSRRSDRHMDNTLRGNSPTPKTGVKEESVVIDYDDLEVPSPPVTVMKFVTMQAHRLGKTYTIPQVGVLIDGHVSLTLIKCANAIRRHIVPVNSRTRTRLRRHGTGLMKARASHVPPRSRAAHRRGSICRGRRVVPVNGRARSRLRRHGTALMKARASHVPA